MKNFFTIYTLLALLLATGKWVSGQNVRFSNKISKSPPQIDAETKQVGAGTCYSPSGSGGSTSKRKEPEVEPPQNPKPPKKVRIDTGPSEAELSSSYSVVVGLPAENAPAVEQPAETIPEQLLINEFLGEVSKAFLKSSFDESASSYSNRAKFQLSFNKVISFEAVSSLDSIEGPLKEKITELERRRKEAEVNFEKANQALSIELEEERGRHELEVGQLRDQVLELQGLVARQYKEIEQLKVGEGLDLDAFIDSDALTNVKDSIEDATGDELIRRSREVHPDLNLSFRTAAEPSSSPTPEVERGLKRKRTNPSRPN